MTEEEAIAIEGFIPKVVLKEKMKNRIPDEYRVCDNCEHRKHCIPQTTLIFSKAMTTSPVIGCEIHGVLQPRNISIDKCPDFKVSMYEFTIRSGIYRRMEDYECKICHVHHCTAGKKDEANSSHRYRDI